jgi:large subunit ribosomal protein L3
MITGIIGKKIDQNQAFLQDGKRIPVTEIQASDVHVVGIRRMDKNGYWAVQLGIGTKKNPSKARLGNVKGAQLKNAPLFLREVRLADSTLDQMPKLGEIVNPSSVFKAGDIVSVTGVSKGKGFAGVVKRHHFKGGPRTHGQSDRERAPGSIGQTTTPGRVYKGKRMAGKMGHGRVTVKNLQVVAVTETSIAIAGLIPGVKNSIVEIRKVGDGEKFVPLYSEKGVEETQKEVQNAS